MYRREVQRGDRNYAPDAARTPERLSKMARAAKPTLLWSSDPTRTAGNMETAGDGRILREGETVLDAVKEEAEVAATGFLARLLSRLLARILGR